jgi:hypothetical protein
VYGVGALLKREIRNEQMKPNGVKLQNAAKIVQFLNQKSRKTHAGPQSARCTMRKFFWLILVAGPNAVDRADPKQADAVPRSMSMHQCRSVSSRDPTLIQFRHLTCFCYACLEYKLQLACHQSHHIPQFTLHRLSPKQAFQAR